MDTWLKTGTLKKSRASGGEPSTSASFVELSTDHALENTEKHDRTDSEDNEQSEEAGTEKSSRDVRVKRIRPTQSEKMSRKLEELQKKKKKKKMHSHSGLTASKNAQKASYLVSYRMAKRGMAHTIGENLCLPVAKDMVNCMLGEKAAKTLDKIPLSNNTVARRIDLISGDILSQLISRIKKSEFFSLQVDESTDVANLSNLLVYVRYLFENTVHEDFLFCRPLATLKWAVSTKHFCCAQKCAGYHVERSCQEFLSSDVKFRNFFVHNPFPLSSCLQDDIWLQKLAYLADIFSTLNELNLSLQGLSTTVINTQGKVEALIKKLVFWVKWINTNSTECFPLLSDFLYDV
ncbi:Zinc finger BED domain-containing protein 5 [Labeo rohita]|uniref:Zinc finger BED domain-containing protein 5 n=1 Tax=Labeo rohita TaxID=84645 RepID=A0ABQ8L806_LABRO|nr:Zinc finger BED domain-containing protein 5 [Labeo rohita]